MAAQLSPETAYLNRHSALIATNAKLRFALLALTLTILGLLSCVAWLGHLLAHFKPMVIRINDVGHAEAISYSDLEYKPQEAEMKFFLIDFLQKYYGLTRGTARQDFTRSLYFLTPELANQRLVEEKQSRTLDNFLLGIGDQIELQIDQISIEDLRQQPYKATVAFRKFYYTQYDHQLNSYAKFTAHVQFVVADKVPTKLVPINPLGLMVTYLREDQAFTDNSDQRRTGQSPAPAYNPQQSPTAPQQQPDPATSDQQPAGSQFGNTSDLQPALDR